MIQVISRAFDILELVAQDQTRLYTLNEISGRLNLNKGTCANIIKSLVTRGYLEQEGRMKGYRLGSMSFLLTGSHLYKRELLAAATGPVKELSEKLNESCILSVLKGGMRLVLFEVNGTHELQVINRKEKDVYRTSTGRMILACMEKDEKKEFVRKYGLPLQDAWPGVEDEDDLMKELQIIRKKQIAVQISKAQIVGMAMPVFIRGKAVASLGIYLPQTRYTTAMHEKIAKELKRTGDMINKVLNEKIPIINEDT